MIRLPMVVRLSLSAQSCRSIGLVGERASTLMRSTMVIRQVSPYHNVPAKIQKELQSLVAAVSYEAKVLSPGASMNQTQQREVVYEHYLGIDITNPEASNNTDRVSFVEQFLNGLTVFRDCFLESMAQSKNGVNNAAQTATA